MLYEEFETLGDACRVCESLRRWAGSRVITEVGVDDAASLGRLQADCDAVRSAVVRLLSDASARLELEGSERVLDSVMEGFSRIGEATP